VAAVGLTVPSGSRSEAKSGICSLVQKAQVMEASMALKKIGAIVSGSTNREATTYVATVLKEKAAEASKILAKCISTIPNPNTFEEAKAQILAAFEVIPSTDAAILEEVHGCAYLDTQMGAPVAGTPASVANLSLDDAQALISSYSTAYGVTVGADPIVLTQALDDFSAKANSNKSLTETFAPAIFTGSDKKISYEQFSLARIALVYEFPTLNTEHAAACKLLPYVLAAQPSVSTGSSLFEPYNSHAKMTREFSEQDCIDSATPFYLPYSDTALFGLSLATRDVRVEDCMWFTTNNLVRLCYDVSESELTRAKTAFATHLLHTMSSPAAIASAYLEDLRLVGRAMPPSELLARVHALELKDIKNVAYTFIHDNDHALAAAGPLHELPDYNWVRTASYNYHY